MEDKERSLIQKFIRDFFSDDKVLDLSDEDSDISNKIMKYVSDRFDAMKYILGLSIDFICLAQSVSSLDRDFQPLKIGESHEDIFKRYKLIEKTGKRDANTLTISFNDKKVGIRKTEELVCNCFNEMQRTNYPSAYVYNTGQWKKYTDLLSLAFMLTENGRKKAVIDLFCFGLENLQKNIFFSRPNERTRLSEKIISEYTRGSSNENGGLILQSIVFGFIVCEFSHLFVIADKVRTGSARQKRIGDIDLYYGLDLEISVEVKDIEISESNFSTSLGRFVENVKSYNTKSIVFCRKASEEIKIQKKNENELHILDECDLLSSIKKWDWHKQDRLVNGMLHYLAHIEQNPVAVTRLLDFIKSKDENHSSLDFHEIFDEYSNSNIQE